MKNNFNTIVFKIFTLVLLLTSTTTFADSTRCKENSILHPVKEDFNNRINFLCKEEDKIASQETCDNVAGTYSIVAAFDSSHCGISITPQSTFTVYVTQKDCTITVSYENKINPDTGDVVGSTATFSGTSLIGNITDIHFVSVTKKGSSINGIGSSTLSGPSISKCIITKSISGTLVK